MNNEERIKFLFDTIFDLFTENEVKELVERGGVLRSERSRLLKIERLSDRLPVGHIAPALVVTCYDQPLPTVSYIHYHTYLCEAELRRLNLLRRPVQDE